MIIDSKLLKGMVAAASKKELRWCLNAVHVKNGVIEATNGHYLFRSEVDTGDENRLFSLTGNIPAKSDSTEINFDAKIATHKDRLGLVVGVSYVEEVEGDFPDCKKIVDDFSSAKSVAIKFDPKYMGLPFKLFNARESTIEIGGEEKASRIKFKINSCEQDVEMYLMPMMKIR